jgi:hypothetical protein
MDFETLAERDVECVFPDGRRQVIYLRIGRPYPAPDIDWCCPVEAVGIYDRPGPIFGVDSWQALQLAQRYLESLVQREVDDGASLHWPPGDSRTISVAELFGRGCQDAEPFSDPNS